MIEIFKSQNFSSVTKYIYGTFEYQLSKFSTLKKTRNIELWIVEKYKNFRFGAYLPYIEILK